MRIFFDINVLLDVGLRREPFFEKSHAILIDGIENHACFISWHTISNLAYIMAKLMSDEETLTFIREITQVCKIAAVEHKDLGVAFEYNSGDFEDALQIASALSVDANVIVTRDLSGFKKSPIELIDPSIGKPSL